jgi:hypothetical protein
MLPTQNDPTIVERKNHIFLYGMTLLWMETWLRRENVSLRLKPAGTIFSFSSVASAASENHSVDLIAGIMDVFD